MKKLIILALCLFPVIAICDGHEMPMGSGTLLDYDNGVVIKMQEGDAELRLNTQLAVRYNFFDLMKLAKL